MKELIELKMLKSILRNGCTSFLTFFFQLTELIYKFRSVGKSSEHYGKESV